MSVRVVKLGGSLLSLADLPERLRQWLMQQSPATTMIVVGGGETVELIRRKQLQWRFDEEVAHVVALRAMDLNAELVSAVLPAGQLQRDWSPSTPVRDGEIVVLACGGWAAGEPAFERSWRTTSDTIAAEISRQVGAAELVMLKSCLPDEARDPSSYLDPLFLQHLPAAIRVRLVDFSRLEFSETVL